MNYANKAVKQNSEVLTITGSNVGIGTVSPGYQLTVAGASNPAGISIQSSSNNAGLDLTSTQVGGREFIVGSAGGSSGIAPSSFFIYDSTASTSRMVINSLGNVGIGTTSPGVKLDVNGNVNISGNL